MPVETKWLLSRKGKVGSAYNLKSVDQLAAVSLSADGLLLKVTFPLFLSEKKIVTKGETLRGLVRVISPTNV